MSRRKGRILAFQALYSWDVGSASLEEISRFDWTATAKGESADAESKQFARLLVTGTVEHITDIDTRIKQHLSDRWNFDRLNRVTLAILRMSVYSLVYQKDMPYTIVIDEAIDIAKEFGPDDAYKFINALLDTISKTPETVKEG